MRRLLTTTAIVVGALYFGTPAEAAIIDFGLNALGNNNEGISHTFSVGTASIIAKDETTIGGQLFGKQDGGDENGLGYTQGSQDEITTGAGYIQINISGLAGKVTGATVDFGTGSVTNGEQWQVWGTNTADLAANQINPGHATLLDSGTSEVSNIPLADVGTYTYLDFVAVGHDNSGANSNFLIADITATAVAAAPEPSSLLILGLGLVGMGAAYRIKRSS